MAPNIVFGVGQALDAVHCLSFPLRPVQDKEGNRHHATPGASE